MSIIMLREWTPEEMGCDGCENTDCPSNPYHEGERTGERLCLREATTTHFTDGTVRVAVEGEDITLLLRLTDMSEIEQREAVRKADAAFIRPYTKKRAAHEATKGAEE